MKKNSTKFDKYYGVQIRQSAICTLKDGRVKTRITVLDPNGKNAHVEKTVIRQTVKDIAADVPKIVEDLIREARPQIVGWLKTGRMDMTLDECLMVFGNEIAAEADSEAYTTAIYLAEENGFVVEIVFRLDGADAAAEADVIMATLSKQIFTE